MIEALVVAPPLHLSFDRTKWNGRSYNTPLEPRKYEAVNSPFITNFKPWNPLGRHPFNILTEEIYSD